METTRPCPSCYYPYATWVHYQNDESPDEVHCNECGFEGVARRGVGADGDAEEHRLNRQALEEEATAHQGLREEAIAYKKRDNES